MKQRVLYSRSFVKRPLILTCFRAPRPVDEVATLSRAVAGVYDEKVAARGCVDVDAVVVVVVVVAGLDVD